MSDEWKVPKPSPCVSCGSLHGSVNAELNCLRSAVLALRSELALARNVADTYLRALAPGR
jgi:hypothetical protein